MVPVGVIVGVGVLVEVGVIVAVLVRVKVGVPVGVLVDVGRGVGVEVGRVVTVKKVEEITPHWLALFSPCTNNRCRPTGSVLVSIVAVTTAVPPPKLPAMGVPDPSGPTSSIE